MECNKEEAIRAKDIAENKMRGKDFIGARKIVLKAQQLFPELENVSQLLTVCEVHCSAEMKINGETDWYAILQVEQTADENIIKKQYRKLALLLHPDKNKFAGAEAAFKLVGEAHRTLTDQAKRSLHDMKRRSNFKTVSLRPPTQPASKAASFTRKHPPPGVSNNAPFNGPNQQPSSQSANVQTFWTICTNCGIRYQYYMSILNRALRCQSCMKPFYAVNLNAQAEPAGANTGYSGIPQPDIRAPGAQTAAPRNYCGNAASMGSQGNVGGSSTSSHPFPNSGFNAEVGDGSKNKAKTEVHKSNEAKFEKVRLQEEKPPAGNPRQKKGRKLVVESSDSESSDSDVVIEEEDGPRQPVGTTGTRRSSRQKQNISYNEDRYDDYGSARPSPNKRLRKAGDKNGNASSEVHSNGVDKQSSGGVVKEERKWKGGEESSMNGEREENLNNNASSPKANPCAGSRQKTPPEGPESVMYPDPEFFDFEKARDESTFEVDQIWAVYDDLDGMPRFYARVMNVYGPEFKIRFTWLEYDPIVQAEIDWSEKELPAACGRFKLGRSQTSTEKAMFSHLVSCRKASKGHRRATYEIYPTKGEVWALFKDWDIGWGADSENHKVFEYEIVEVLSDFDECTGIRVVNLVKVNGFVCLFKPAVDCVPHEISPSQILRFSHRVPYYRMTGKERENIPPGSFELDATSLPSNFAECFPSVNPESIKLSNNFQASGEAAGKHVETETVASKHQVEAERQNIDDDDNEADEDNDSTVAYEYPDPEFCNFEETRSKDKFEHGQIWALYSEIAGYPNYYGRIEKIEPGDFHVHVQWLEVHIKKDEKMPRDKDLPVSCGTFKLVSDMTEFKATNAFSHIVHPVFLDRKGLYAIYPNQGEIWARYKNWSREWSRTDLEECEYEVVEVLARSDSGVKVVFLRNLTKVPGYRCVFMPGSVRYEVPATEYARFSHQIPAFRLTEEKGGKLRGYWELDPASVPQVLLIMDSD